jgi:hypothetical protein
MGNMLLPDFLDLENIYDWLIPSSKVAQWKHAGPITQRSMERLE